MSTTFVDDGIVLRRIDYAEADRILTVLTREHGKVGVIARGVRKPRARLAGQADLFSRSRMQLAKGRGDLLTLTQAEAVGGALAMTDATRIACAGVVAELADRVLESNHPDADTYDLVSASLTDIFDAHRDPRAGVAWCARRLIQGLGYAPQLRQCIGCNEPLAEASAWFSASGGGLLCTACANNDAAAVECSVRVIKVLRRIQDGDAGTYLRLRLDDATLSTLEEVVERELAQHLERRLNSLDVLRALRR